MKVLILLVVMTMLLSAPNARAEKVLVAVAANFSHSMQLLVRAFEKNNPHQVELAFGSSGKFYAQIIHGAPYDVFLSADQAKPLALEQKNKIVTNSRFTYAVGRLVLWSAKAEFNHQVEQRFKGLRFKQLAMANPRVAPYGLAADQVLTKLRFKDSADKKWVLGENVSQVFQFVASGNLDLGFVALSQVINQSVAQDQYWLVPTHYHQPIQQDGVWLNKAKDNPAASALINFLQSKQAQSIISKQGYLSPKRKAL